MTHSLGYVKVEFENTTSVKTALATTEHAEIGYIVDVEV